MIRRALAIGLLVCASFFGAWAEAATQSAEELPLPADVYRVSDSTELMMGQQPIQAQHFVTRLTPEQLRVFYTDALAKQGWTIETMPGMDEFVRHQSSVREMIKAHQAELEQDQETKTKLDELLAAHPAELVQHQIHAVRGKSHLVIHNTAEGEKRTLVFINRWEDRAPSKTAVGPMGAESSNAGTGGLMANPCCSGAEVPAALRQLPDSVPRYPNARMVSTGASPTALKSELYFSPDAPEQITAYYRQHMAYNGWKSTKDTGTDRPEIRNMLGDQAASMNASILTYRSDRAYCGIVVAERVNVQRLPLGTEVDTTSRDAEGPTSAERSVIMITYLAIPSPERPPIYAPKRLGGR